MFELRQWHVAERGGVVVARGDCVGNPRFPGGGRVVTSEVLSARLEGPDVVLGTRNSAYRCRLGEYQAWRGGMGLLAGSGDWLTEAEASAALAAAAAARRALLEERWLAAEPLLRGAGGPCAALFVDSSAACSFRQLTLSSAGRHGHMAEEDACVHVGTFQDSVLLVGEVCGVGVNFRFFPLPGRRIEFYAWDGGVAPVVILNVGEVPVEVATPLGRFPVGPDRPRVVAGAGPPSEPD